MREEQTQISRLSTNTQMQFNAEWKEKYYISHSVHASSFPTIICQVGEVRWMPSRDVTPPGTRWPAVTCRRRKGLYPVPGQQTTASQTNPLQQHCSRSKADPCTNTGSTKIILDASRIWQDLADVENQWNADVNTGGQAVPGTYTQRTCCLKEGHFHTGDTKLQPVL